jgi:hypothetical protein
VAKQYLRALKKAYCDKLTLKGEIDRAKEIYSADLYDPIFKVRTLHPDSEPNIDEYNEMMDDIIRDLSIITTEIGQAAYDIRGIMTDVNVKLFDIKNTLAEEKEKLFDMSILCSKYPNINAVTKLTANDFSGDFSTMDNMLCAKITGTTPISYEVVSVEGNGYEGNDYVFKNGAFLKNTIDTANRAFINDGSEITVYEYSRITADNSEKQIFSDVNLDSIEANCTVTLSSTIKFNNAKIKSDSQGLKIVSVLVSDNGTLFKEVIEDTLQVNDASNKYDVVNYIPGSGLICFPDTNYVKIVFQSNGYTDDIIAFVSAKAPDASTNNITNSSGTTVSKVPFNYSFTKKFEFEESETPNIPDTIICDTVPECAGGWTLWSDGEVVNTGLETLTKTYGFSLRVSGSAGATFNSVIADFYTKYPGGLVHEQDDGYSADVIYGNPTQYFNPTIPDVILVDFHPIGGDIIMKKVVQTFTRKYSGRIDPDRHCSYPI